MLIYIAAFMFIILNNLIADEVVVMFENEHVIIPWAILVILLSAHVFVLGTGFTTILGW